jgi:hypothetical protein
MRDIPNSPSSSLAFRFIHAMLLFSPSHNTGVTKQQKKDFLILDKLSAEIGSHFDLIALASHGSYIWPSLSCSIMNKFDVNDIMKRIIDLPSQALTTWLVKSYSFLSSLLFYLLLLDSRPSGENQDGCNVTKVLDCIQSHYINIGKRTVKIACNAYECHLSCYM